jgi:hypothetical protein
VAEWRQEKSCGPCMVGGVDTVGMTGLVSMDTIGMVPMSTSAVKVDIADVIEKVGMVSTSRMRIGATVSSIWTIGAGFSSSIGAGTVKTLGALLSVVMGHTGPAMLVRIGIQIGIRR